MDDPILVFESFAAGLPMHAAYGELRPGQVRRHGHDFFETMLVLEGELDTGAERLVPGDLRWIAPGDVHALRGRGASYINVALPAPLVRGVQSLAPDLALLARAEAEGLRPAFENAVRAFAAGPRPLDALAFLATFRLPPASENVSAPIRRARAILGTDRGLARGLEAMREAAFVSEAHLARLWRRETGATLTEELRARRLERAREILLTSPLDVASVALRVGYPSPSHFHRDFRARYGVTPRAMRLGAARATAP